VYFGTNLGVDFSVGLTKGKGLHEETSHHRRPQRKDSSGD